MLNIIESFFMGAWGGTGYGEYQIVSGFLNGMLCLAVGALAMEWSGKRMAIIAAALLALNPWFMQNATYPWTKLYSEFYVILGIWLYRRQFRELAMIMLAAGCLIHYSVALVPVYIAIYDAIFHRRQWRQIVRSWVAGALLLGTWVAWGFAKFGQTFTRSTTTVTEAQRRSWGNLGQILIWNAWHSLVPMGFDPSAISRIAHSPIELAVRVRDILFLAYEPGLILSWGVGGLMVMIWCLTHSHFARGKFWIGLVLFTYIGGLLLHTPPGYDYGGVAHVVMQPIVWIGMVWIISRITEMPRWLIKLWCAGVFIDALWLMLHFGLESKDGFQFNRGEGTFSPVDPAVGSHVTIYNAFTQVIRNQRFLGMETVECDALLLTAMMCVACVWWLSLRESLRRASARVGRG